MVVATFMKFGQCAGVAWCGRSVGGTRQCSCSCGGGDHNVYVNIIGCCTEGDVGSVDGCVPCVGGRMSWRIGVCGGFGDGLFDEWLMSSDVVDYFGESVSEGIMSSDSVWPVFAC